VEVGRSKRVCELLLRLIGEELDVGEAATCDVGHERRLGRAFAHDRENDIRLVA
jgi:hypothetical protein